MLRIEQKQNIGKELCRYSPRFEHNLEYIKETALFHLFVSEIQSLAPSI